MKQSYSTSFPQTREREKREFVAERLLEVLIQHAEAPTARRETRARSSTESPELTTESLGLTHLY